MPLGSGPVKKQKGKLAGCLPCHSGCHWNCWVGASVDGLSGKQVLVDVMHPPKFRSP